MSALAVRHQNPGNCGSEDCHRVMCTLQPDPGGDYVFALGDRPVFARFLMFIVALLQSVLFGRSRQKFATGSWSRRMSVSSVVCVIGTVYDSTILMFIVALLQSVWFGRSCQEVGVDGSWCRRKFVSPGVVLGHPRAPVFGYELYCVHSWQPEFSLIWEDRNL